MGKLKQEVIVKISALGVSGMEHIYQVEKTLEASEIWRAIALASHSSHLMVSPDLPQCQYAPWNPLKFAVEELGDLNIDEVRFLVKENLGALPTYLENQNAGTLQDTHSALIESNILQKVPAMRNKSDFIREILLAGEEIALTTMGHQFIKTCLVSKGRVEGENQGGVVRIDDSMLVYGPEQVQTISGNMTQYWRIQAVKYRSSEEAFREKIELEFFHDTKSIFKVDDNGNHCILNVNDPAAPAVLEEFVDLQNEGTMFGISPIEIPAEKFLPRGDSSEWNKEHTVHWPNRLDDLKGMFGVQRKTKYETLKQGLRLLGRLEQAQNLVETMIGQKLIVSSNGARYFLGEALSAKVLQVLILHLRLDYVSPTKEMITTVQKKETDETLNCAWQHVEESGSLESRLVGYQV